MTPWEVIQEALLHRRPIRNLQWLAEQLGVSIQAVVNWRARGVPANRYRDIAAALGINIDQLEGIEPPPWEAEKQAVDGLSPEVSEVATAINALPKRQRDWVLTTVREAIGLAQQTIGVNETAVNRSSSSVGRERDQTETKRTKSG